jgi:hypothetical protein
MVADAQDSALALRDLIKGQISNDELGIHNAPRALGASWPSAAIAVVQRGRRRAASRECGRSIDEDGDNET